VDKFGIESLQVYGHDASGIRFISADHSPIMKGGGEQFC